MPGWPNASRWSAQLVAETGLKDAVIVPTPADRRADRPRARPRHRRLSRAPSRREPGARARHRLGRHAARDRPPPGQRQSARPQHQLDDGRADPRARSSTPSRSPASSPAASTRSATTSPRRSIPAARSRATPSWPRTCSAKPSSGWPPSTWRCMSVGDLSRRSLLIRYGLPRDVTVEFAARGRRRRRHHGHLPRRRGPAGPASGEQAGDRRCRSTCCARSTPSSWPRAA